MRDLLAELNCAGDFDLPESYVIIQIDSSQTLSTLLQHKAIKFVQIYKGL